MAGYSLMDVELEPKIRKEKSLEKRGKTIHVSVLNGPVRRSRKMKKKKK